MIQKMITNNLTNSTITTEVNQVTIHTEMDIIPTTTSRASRMITMREHLEDLKVIHLTKTIGPLTLAMDSTSLRRLPTTQLGTANSTNCKNTRRCLLITKGSGQMGIKTNTVTNIDQLMVQTRSIVDTIGLKMIREAQEDRFTIAKNTIDSAK